MSNFWADKLAGTTPAQAPPRQTVATPSASPWWMPAPTTPRQEPVEAVSAPSYGMGSEIDPERAARLSRLAPSSTKDDRCPSCYSSNYITFNATQVVGKSTSRCYDCGYPVVQSSSGDTMPSGTGEGQPTKAARQLAPGGYHPEIIVGRTEH